MKKDMTNIEQKTTLGSKDVTQIGVQNNYYGLSMSDILDLVRKVSDEQYQRLRPELVAELDARIEQKARKIATEVLDENTATDEEVAEMLRELWEENRVFGEQS